MIYLDILFLIIIIWGAYNGFLNGLVKELSALLSLIFGIVLAKNLYPILDEKLNALTDSKLISIISAVIIFILTIIIFKIGAKIATKFINFVYLGFINKLLGSIFGGIKSLLILCFLVFIFLKINTNIQIVNPDNLEESTIYVQIKKINKVILQNSYIENGSEE